MSERQARLRQEYEEWYPGISPATWHNAAWLVEKVLHQRRHGSPRWAVEGRALSGEHFEFQGQSQTPRQPRRSGDPPGFSYRTS